MDIDHNIAIIEKLIEAGMAILPCKGKDPYHALLNGRGVYDATTDMYRIKRWVKVGLNLGATCFHGGILHIDVDPRNGGTHEAWQALRLSRPKTWGYVTGRGDGGTHYFYKIPKHLQITQHHLGPGIDILGPGKYGVIPPSIHPDTGNPYLWFKGCSPLHQDITAAPQELIDAVTETYPERISSDFIVDEVEFNDIENALACIPNDDLDYDSWFYILCALKWASFRSTGDIPDRLEKIARVWSKKSTKYNETVYEKVWKHIKETKGGRGPITIQRLYNVAMSNGWDWVEETILGVRYHG